MLWNLYKQRFSPGWDSGIAKAGEPDLDVLPNVRFRIDDAHIRLIGTPIHKGSVVHLQERISSVVLPTYVSGTECRKLHSMILRVSVDLW